MIVIVILSFCATAILSYSLTSYRNSVRQALLDQAREAADSEMQYLYYQWKTAILAKHPPGTVDVYLQSYPGTLAAAAAAQGYAISQNLTPFYTPPVNRDGGGSWSISRTVQFNSKYVAGSPTTDGSAVGIFNNSGGQVGRIYYYTAKTRATFNSPIFGNVEFHSGRNFQYASASLFIYAVFYQGNLELAAAGDFTISGAVSTNASAYMGAQNGGSLTLTNNVFYFQDYEGAADPLSGTQLRLIPGSSLLDPTYNPDPGASAPSNQTAQRGVQVHPLVQQQSFSGGVDVAAALANYPLAYTNPATGLVDPNEVYRAVIAPPPDAPGTTTLTPEDPSVSATRLYNSAGVIVTISNTNGTTNVQIGNTSAGLAAYYDSTDASNDTDGHPLTTAMVNAIIPTATRRQTVVDKREYANGTPSINLTTVDIGQLNNVISTVVPADTSGANAIGNSYNGLVYIYDNTNNNTLATTTSNPSLTNTQNAVLLKNAEQTPALNDSSGNPLGFSVVSNNGIYVRGDYNIQPITVDGQTVPNPSAIMGDAITAVSDNWQAGNSALGIASRVATTDPYYPLTTASILARDPPPTGTTEANQPLSGIPPTLTTLGVPSGGGMTINAAILTGNTPSDTNTDQNSGGVQNLVRLEENWTGLNLCLVGSVGQLFTSDYFRGPYLGNQPIASLSPANDVIYSVPANRFVIYDPNLSTRTPNGTPTTTSFTLGSFFFW
jgi:type II secretory pathway pseudopilin PulG